MTSKSLSIYSSLALQCGCLPCYFVLFQKNLAGGWNPGLGLRLVHLGLETNVGSGTSKLALVIHNV